MKQVGEKQTKKRGLCSPAFASLDDNALTIVVTAAQGISIVFEAGLQLPVHLFHQQVDGFRRQHDYSPHVSRHKEPCWIRMIEVLSVGRLCQGRDAGCARDTGSTNQCWTSNLK